MPSVIRRFLPAVAALTVAAAVAPVAAAPIEEPTLEGRAL